MSDRAGTRGPETVPLSERLRVMQYARAAAVGLVLLGAAAAPDVLAPGRGQVVAATLLYAGLVALGELAAVLLRHRLVVVLGGLLLLDGVWLAWAGYLSGAADSPLRYLVLLHLAAVALLASYRTALKLALWHSLLLYLVHDAVDSGALPSPTPSGTDGAGLHGELAVFVLVLWLVALCTSVLSSVNERELRRRRADLEELAGLAERLEDARDPAEAAQALLDSAVTTAGAPRGVVLAGPEGQLTLLAAHGLETLPSGRAARPGPSAVVERAQAGRGAVLVRALDPSADAWLSRLLPDAQDVVVVPLSAEGRSLGALVVEAGRRRRGGRLPRRVLSALERSAAYAALSLRNAWLVDQLRRLAATDGLTKIANRRTFESTLEREVARATRSGDPVSLVMIDIDHFKRLNDQQGHQAGDEVLRNVAAALSCECRDFDTAARYGGEEFVVVLPGCGPDEAGLIAERLRGAVATAPSVVPITASAGVASYPAHAGDADGLVKAADDALYASKDAGRDRTTVSTGLVAGASVEALLRRAVAQRLSAEDRRPVEAAAGPPGERKP